MDIEHELASAAEDAHVRETYYKVVANWNEYVARAAGEERFCYEDYCRYLLDIYTELSSHEARG
jgi:hypothetical protein